MPRGSGFVFRRTTRPCFHAAGTIPEHDDAGLLGGPFTTTRSGRRERKGHGERNEETQGMEGGHPAAAAFAAPAAEEEPRRRDDERHGDGDDPGSGIELPAFDHERD